MADEQLISELAELIEDLYQDEYGIPVEGIFLHIAGAIVEEFEVSRIPTVLSVYAWNDL